ncbi:MAG TPA: HAD family hydrolase [Methanotrichaceae archaeon]|nr:HAD family hydrolase [Methanotrichaceae archaeon]
MLKRQGIDGVKGFIFDCYNTLLDVKTDEDSLDTYKPVSNWLIYQGVRISPEEFMTEFKRMIGTEMATRWEKYPEIKIESIFGRICKQHALWNIDEITMGVETSRTFRAGSLRKIDVLHPSVRLLKELEGYPMCIVSNAQRVFTEPEIEYLDLAKYFKFIIYSSDFGHKKPDPRIFLAAARQLGLKPEEVMSIGDTFDNDIAPASKLGMKAMHIEEAWRYFKVI